MYRFLDRVHSYLLHSDHAKHAEHATHSIGINKDEEQQTEHKLRKALRVQQCQIKLTAKSDIRHWRVQDAALDFIGIEWQMPDELALHIHDAEYSSSQWYSLLVPSLYVRVAHWYADVFGVAMLLQHNALDANGRQMITAFVQLPAAHIELASMGELTVRTWLDLLVDRTGGWTTTSRTRRGRCPG